MFIEERAGQLFKDIAIAICSAIVISLLVSITVIPSLSARILKVSSKLENGKSKKASTIKGVVQVVENLGHTTIVHLQIDKNTIIVNTKEKLEAKPGQTVEIAVDTPKCYFFNPKTEARLN